jgi:MFS family permease
MDVSIVMKFSIPNKLLIIFRPFAAKFGRRPVYLLSNLLMGIACIWLGIATTKTYTVLLLGRAFLGIFEAPIESIAPSTITDIFFLHERGEKVSLYGLSVLGGNELGPMFSAFIIQGIGLDWAFYVIAISIALSFVSMFFSMPETKFTGLRPVISIPEESFAGEDGESIKNSGQIEMKTNASITEPGVSSEILPENPYIHSLTFWGQNDPTISLRKAFTGPFILLGYPTVLWSCLIYGLALGWNVVLGATVAQLFEPP